MTGARQTVALLVTFRRSNKKSLEFRNVAYRAIGKKYTLYIPPAADKSVDSNYVRLVS